MIRYLIRPDVTKYMYIYDVMIESLLSNTIRFLVYTCVSSQEASEVPRPIIHCAF